MFNLLLRIYNLFKNFLLSKIGIAIIFLIIGISTNRFINYLNNQQNASKSTIANFRLWLDNSKQQVSKKQIFKFDGTKFVKEIATSIDNKIDNQQSKFQRIKQSLIDKLNWQVSLPKGHSLDQETNRQEPINANDKANDLTKDLSTVDKKNEIKDSQDKPVAKTSEIRKYEDEASFSYDLVLQGYRFEEVIIAINNNQLSLSNSLSHKTVIEISSGNSSNSKNADSSNKIVKKDLKNIQDLSKKTDNNQGFSYVLELDRYDHKIDPEITYRNNIITVKFFKLKKNNRNY
ncbi:hypothetical protein LBMAG18_08590 [Alphaproteobacteria bacterium]|nr:hypothetical protein LBMAG18_08590 [Alphaproteobacteria bacterium]